MAGTGSRSWRAPALLRRFPRLVLRADPAAIVAPGAADDLPERSDDFAFLDRVLLPRFQQSDEAALRAQNRHRRQQLVLLVAGSAGAVLGAVQAAVPAPWPGIVLAAVTAASGVFALQVQRGDALRRYLRMRSRAETLRSLYFRYLLGLEPYDGPERRQALREAVQAACTEADR